MIPTIFNFFSNKYICNYFTIWYSIYRSAHLNTVRSSLNIYIYTYVYLISKVLGFMDLLPCQTESDGFSYWWFGPNWLYPWKAGMCFDKITFINPNYWLNNHPRTITYSKKHWSYSLTRKRTSHQIINTSIQFYRVENHHTYSKPLRPLLKFILHNGLTKMQ